MCNLVALSAVDLISLYCLTDSFHFETHSVLQRWKAIQFVVYSAAIECDSHVSLIFKYGDFNDTAPKYLTPHLLLTANDLFTLLMPRYLTADDY